MVKKTSSLFLFYALPSTIYKIHENPITNIFFIQNKSKITDQHNLIIQQDVITNLFSLNFFFVFGDTKQKVVLIFFLQYSIVWKLIILNRNLLTESYIKKKCFHPFTFFLIKNSSSEFYLCVFFLT